MNLVTFHEGPEAEYRFSSTISSTSALDGIVWLTPHRGRSTLGPVPIVKEAGWAPGPV